MKSFSTIAGLDARTAPYALFLLRLALGAMWISHALLKILVFTLPGAAGFFESVGLPGFLVYPVVAAEIAGGFAFANPAQVRYGVERIAGGNFSWNHDVDYAALVARSGMLPLVEALYAKSGISLQADLQTLARAPRIAATAAAVATAEKTTSYTGKVRGPIVVVDNIADPVDADAFKRAYERTLTNAGTGMLLRTTWVRSVGHASQSALEKITGFVTLIDRLDTGTWSDTSPEAMTQRAARIAAPSGVDLGRARFIPHDAPDMLRPWDGSHWGSYVPR